MQRRYNLTHFLLASVVVLGLTLLMGVVEAQARIVLDSNRDGNSEIYVMDADGGILRKLTKHSHNDTDPAWHNPAFTVAPAGKKFTIWGQLKQIDR